MSSENPTGAGNQQERPSSSDWLDAIPLDLGHYIAGFVDGEGSFNVPIRRERDRGLPWRVSLSFNVSQLGPEAPSLLRQVFGVGTVRGRGDGVFYFEVTRPSELEARVFPFFERFPLVGSKAQDFHAWRQAIAILQRGRLSESDLATVLALREGMNRGGKRRHRMDGILRDYTPTLPAEQRAG